MEEEEEHEEQIKEKVEIKKEEVKKGIDAPERKMLNPGNNNPTNTDTSAFDGNQWTVEDSSDMPF